MTVNIDKGAFVVKCVGELVYDITFRADRNFLKYPATGKIRPQSISLSN